MFLLMHEKYFHLGKYIYNFTRKTKQKRSLEKRRVTQIPFFYEKKTERKVCGCQATAHSLLTNCLNCGNIVCVVEANNPCSYCGKELNVKRQSKALSSTSDGDLNKAMELKDRLLRYGVEKKTTRIVDDSGDFYENDADNIWLSQLERQRAREKQKENEEKMNQSRADVSVEIALDIGRGTIETIEDKTPKYITVAKPETTEERTKEVQSYYQSNMTGRASEVYASLQKLMRSESAAIANTQKQKQQRNHDVAADDDEDANNPDNGLDHGKHEHGSEFHRLQDAPYFEQADEQEEDDNATTSDNKTRPMKKVADEDGNEEKKKNEEDNAPAQNIGLAMSDIVPTKKRRKRGATSSTRSKYYGNEKDEGVCLSMHQPWASLLVCGIKRIEGRSWNTQNRKTYMEVYNKSKSAIPFPKDYPCSAVLGCVDLVECLSNEEYTEQYVNTSLSKELNTSAFCFIVERPMKLLLPSAITGDHKLFKIPSQRIQALAQGLRPVSAEWQNASAPKPNK
ncbi:hypothetical protein RFI_05811 [Reticulomyxa filosa]|uniref:Zinc finger C2HC5-type domain-containing protein n=1 Tax=Reticulomyxa filosa TaxID=46433 RepID=X6P179_RETFI|nr:hypothetical protein RFI_05811 [Reticulomyxa filosa]|eukprot:ETO31307.1 hypothetical protein RFI_05811 [Reticulomyxa filosa]